MSGAYPIIQSQISIVYLKYVGDSKNGVKCHPSLENSLNRIFCLYIYMLYYNWVIELLLVLTKWDFFLLISNLLNLMNLFLLFKRYATWKSVN